MFMWQHCCYGDTINTNLCLYIVMCDVAVNGKIFEFGKFAYSVHPKLNL